MKTTNKTPRTIKATIAAIIADFPCSGFGNGFKSIDGLKAPEIAAKLGLDELRTFKALDKLEACGLVKYERTGRLGCVGYFRTVKGLIAHQLGMAEADDAYDEKRFELAAG